MSVPTEVEFRPNSLGGFSNKDVEMLMKIGLGIVGLALFALWVYVIVNDIGRPRKD